MSTTLVVIFGRKNGHWLAHLFFSQDETSNLAHKLIFLNVIARSRGKTNEEKDIHWDSLRRGNGQRAHLVIRENEFESCPLITSPQPPPCQFMKCLVVSSWYYLNQPFLIGIISTSCYFRLIKTLLWYATEILKRFSIKKLINFVIFQVGNFPSKFALIYEGRLASERAR